MKLFPASLVALVRLFRRDGPAFFNKCARYAFSRDAWAWLLRGGAARSEPPESPPPPPEPFRPVPFDAPPEERERSRRMMGGWHPEISVVVTSYNYAHVLRETLDALVAQTYPAREILVVDNGSTDGSPDIVREYAAKFPIVRLLQHAGCVNKGLPASVKLGVETASGEFVGFCEADDVWTADHLERKVELLREHWGEPNVVINDIETFGEPDRCAELDREIAKRASGLAGRRNRISPVAFREMNWICTFSIVLARRSVLLGCDFLSVPRPSNLDWWLWRQICFDNDVWVVHRKLTRWRLHGDSYLMRDGTSERMADLLEMNARMDRILLDRHPVSADGLRPFLRPEDVFSCRDGRLAFRFGDVPQPSFSILLSVGSDPERLRRTIESIRNQTYRNFEVVALVGGFPLTLPEVRSLLVHADAPAIRIVDFRPSAPAAAPFPADAVLGMESAKEWILPLEAGDVLRPDALKTFACRAILDPGATSIHAVAQGSATGRSFLLPRPLSVRPHFCLACSGAFALRREDGAPPPAACLAGLSRRRPFPVGIDAEGALFVEHVVLIRMEDAPIEFPPTARASHAAGEAGPDALEALSSPWFDPAWLSARTLPVPANVAELAVRYLFEGADGRVSPGPDFVADEYLALNPDVTATGANPLLHYARAGKSEGRSVSFLETAVPPPPEGAVPVRRSFSPRPARTRRTAVFASHSSDGRVSDRVLFYLRGLVEVVDNVVFVASNPLLPGEADRLEGLATEILAEPHAEYDFGSYKRGLRIARERNLLDSGAADEFVLCNDSCYGPVFPFEEMFAAMLRKNCDFWGATENEELASRHLQSFFLVFRRRVLDDGALDSFLDGVVALPGRGGVVLRYETALTDHLRKTGFRPAAFVPFGAVPAEKGASPNPMLRPLFLLRDFRIPLVKVKALDGEIEEPLEEALAFLRKANPELAGLVVSRPRDGESESSRKLAWLRSLREGLPASFPAKVAAWRARAAKGGPLRCVFFVKSADEFPARALFDAMSADASGRFRPVVCVVPDYRSARPESGMDRCFRAQVAALPAGSVFQASRGEGGAWEDVLRDAALAVYPPRPDETAFPYAPHWAVGRDFLPIFVPDDGAGGQEGDVARFWKIDIDPMRLFSELGRHLFR